MTEPVDYSDLVAKYQALCVGISFFEEMNWQNEALQDWLNHHSLSHCATPWQLPPAALWILIQSLEKKLFKLHEQHFSSDKKPHESRLILPQLGKLD